MLRNLGGFAIEREEHRGDEARHASESHGRAKRVQKPSPTKDRENQLPRRRMLISPWAIRSRLRSRKAGISRAMPPTLMVASIAGSIGRAR
jgi:hypothetical protein